MTRHRTNAFSLIELLVVISIIAILVAILLPVLGAAKFTTQITQCASNFHQAGLAATNYAADHKAQLPAGDITFPYGPNPNVISQDQLKAMLDYGQGHVGT